MTTETPKKKKILQILKTDTASKLAENWVAKMTKLAEEETIEAEQEIRPHRLGLGAEVPRLIKRGPFNDPLDQTLQAKLRKYAKTVAESSRNMSDDSEDYDESESKSQSFSKKRRNPSRQP